MYAIWKYTEMFMSLTYTAKILNIKSIKIIPGKSHLAVKKKKKILLIILTGP